MSSSAAPVSADFAIVRDELDLPAAVDSATFPAVRPRTLARCVGTKLAEGARIRVRLTAADPTTRTVHFTAQA